LLHQGTERTTCDFIVSATGANELSVHHEKLLANCLAQSEALMKGSVDTAAGLDSFSGNTGSRVPYKQFSGDRPSNTILIDKLTPKRLGSLIALYEHKIFVQGIIWDINSFDQWGVELGKKLAGDIYKEISPMGQPRKHDSSTSGLISRCVAMRKIAATMKPKHLQFMSNVTSISSKPRPLYSQIKAKQFSNG